MTACTAARETIHPGELTARRGVARVAGLPPVRYEICGNPCGPAVVVLGGISASRHVTSNEVDGRAGWWEHTVGGGCAIDTNELCVIGIDYVTAGRTTIVGDVRGRGAQASGSKSRNARSIVTTFDQANAITSVLDAISVRAAGAIVGASYGGMVALAFAERYPERVERVVVISAAHESDPLTTTLRAIQRRIVRLAQDAGNSGEGVALARALAMTTYRTRAEFAQRFSNIPDWSGVEPVFPAEGYVIARGEDYAARTAPNDFVALTLSLDLHAVDPGRIRVPTTLIGIREDALVPIEKMRELQRSIGGAANLVELSSIHGHDAFLADSALLAPEIAKALAKSRITSSPLLS